LEELMTNDWTVVLVRHAEAVSTCDNPQRPLSIAGRQHAERMATWLREMRYRSEEVVHSDKLRARQTAKILGQRLDIHPAKVHEIAGLGPGDDPLTMADGLEAERRSVMVVGHLPYMARLASTLLVGEPDRLQIRFFDAGTVVLSRGAGGWQLEAVVSHEMVP
jgi:phosphohistidine phosphatase